MNQNVGLFTGPSLFTKNLKEKHLNMNQDVGTFLAPPCSVPK